MASNREKVDVSDNRDILRRAGDILAESIGIEPLGGSVDTILAPLAGDVTAAYDAAQEQLSPNAREFTRSVRDHAARDAH